MQHTTVRRLADTERIRKLDSPRRHWLALLLMAVSAIGGYAILGRDIDWETRRREARAEGLTAENNGNFEAARRHYETALTNHPYDWETHLSLAKVLFHHLSDNDGALRHFLYALAYSPDPSIAASARNEIDILKLMRAGELENPLDALEDMFLAVEAGAADTFARRLSLGLRGEFPRYWEAWRKRGRGQVTFHKVASEQDGFYDAILEIDFTDGTSMSMHLSCTLRNIWRIQLSFP